MFQSLLNMGLRKNSNGRPEIAQVSPVAAIAGGEFQIRGKGFTKPQWPRVLIGDVVAPIDGLVTFIRGVPSAWKGATLATVLPVITSPQPWKAPNP